MTALRAVTRGSSKSFGKRKMIATNATVDDRLPVWNVLSELFLDTELQEDDHQRIARVLAASPYSEKKLDEILRFEVTPVLKCNLLSMAGEWAGFDEAWLREKLKPRIDTRPWFRPSVFWMMRRRWKHIIGLVAKLREQKPNQPPEPTASGRGSS